MLVYLSGLETIITGYTKFSEITSFSRGVEDSEAKTLVCDFFLSGFEKRDVDKVLSLILKKIRIGGTLVINDFDFQELFSKAQELANPLQPLNNVLASKTKMLKSFLDLDEVKSYITQNAPNFESQIEGLNNGTFTISLQRKS